MNKKVVTIAILGFFVFSSVAVAKANNILPPAGIKPDSFFFFLDRLGESIQEFFTFNPEAKVRLQIRFAGERIAEINALVETKGLVAEGVDKAKKLLVGNVAQAAEIIKKEKSNGKDISKLAKEIDDKFDAQEQLLVQTFQDARRKLKEDRLILKKTLAEQADNITLVSTIEKQIRNLDAQDNQLKDKKDEIKESLRGEKGKIENELNRQDRETHKRQELEEGKKEKEEDARIENDNEVKEEVETKETPEVKEIKDDGASEDAKDGMDNGKDSENKDGEAAGESN